jgi:hypothetical protein
MSGRVHQTRGCAQALELLLQRHIALILLRTGFSAPKGAEVAKIAAKTMIGSSRRSSLREVNWVKVINS